MSGQVQSAAIYDELARILQSEEFQRSARLRKFLSVIVDRTLRGKAAEIKELTLAVMVFGRDPSSFDAQRDPIDTGLVATKPSGQTGMAHASP